MEQPTTTRKSRVDQLSRWLRSADRWVRQSTGSARTRALLVAILITLTLSILGWSVYREWDVLAAFDWQFDLRYLGLSFLCYSLGLSLWLSSWHGIMGRLAGFTNLRLNVKIYLYSITARRLPGFVWYLGSLLYLYQQEAVPKTLTSVGLLLESTLVSLSGLLVFLGAMPFSRVDLLPDGSLWFLVGVVPLLAVVVQPSWLIRGLNAILPKLGRARLDLQIRWQDSVRWVAQYIAGSIGSGLVLYCLARAIHPLPAEALPGVIGVTALTPVLRLIAFFVPGGWGLQELSLSMSLSPYLPLPIALGIPLIFRLWFVACELAWVVTCYLICDVLAPLIRK